MRTVFELGISSAVIAFNEGTGGAEGLCKVLENLGITEGKCSSVNHEEGYRKRNLTVDRTETEKCQ